MVTLQSIKPCIWHSRQNFAYGTVDRILHMAQSDDSGLGVIGSFLGGRLWTGGVEDPVRATA
jgi:hypothetical protein